MRMKSRVFVLWLALFGAAAAAPASSKLQAQTGANAQAETQTRVPVLLTVENARGEAVPGANVRAMARGLDTTVRVNARGRLTLPLPAGLIHFAVSSMGYEVLQQDVEVSSSRKDVQFVLVPVAQQLGAREIREHWIGVRGVIGDVKTRRPIPNAEVMIAQFQRVVRTDGAGRFEIPLPSAAQVVVQISGTGYQTRVTGFGLNENEATDVVFFLTPGKDINGQKNTLRDLQQRLTTTPLRSFVASRQQLSQRGASTVYDALVGSGLLSRMGLRFGDKVCVLIDGHPVYGFPPTAIALADVDFVEVFGYKSDMGGSLASEWGHHDCSAMPASADYDSKFVLPKPEVLMQSGDLKRLVEFVVVWKRK